MTVATAYVGLGGNLGDRLTTLRSASTQLGAAPDVGLTATSHVYETSPIGPSAEPFLNAAAAVTTTLGPVALLDLLHAIERAHGRERRVRWDARTLDLDLLLYIPGDGEPLVRDEGRCRLPHPRMLERDFVLAPLADLVPDLRVEGTAIAQHLASLCQADRTVLRRLDRLGPHV